LIRNFNQLQDSEIVICADLDNNRLKHMQNLYPHTKVTNNYKDLFVEGLVDAVVVATPPDTHHKLAIEALNAGKHVFVEQPLAMSVAEGSEMVATAEKNNLTLMVGHTFVYTAAVNKIKEIVDSGELGDIYYINSTRVNLGIFQEKISVIWDLAPHDVSIFNYILGTSPLSVATQSHSYIRGSVDDVAFVNVRYPNDVMTDIHVSWLDPNKIRSTTVVGSKKMLVYDDVSFLEKIRIYDKGVDVQPHYDTFGEFQLSYRFGDIFIPKLDDAEPLKVACQHFVDCIEKGITSRSSGQSGLEVVGVLEAAAASAKEDGRMIDIDPVATNSKADGE